MRRNLIFESRNVLLSTFPCRLGGWARDLSLFFPFLTALNDIFVRATQGARFELEGSKSCLLFVPSFSVIGIYSIHCVRLTKVKARVIFSVGV